MRYIHFILYKSIHHFTYTWRVNVHVFKQDSGKYLWLFYYLGTMVTCDIQNPLLNMPRLFLASTHCSEKYRTVIFGHIKEPYFMSIAKCL